MKMHILIYIFQSNETTKLLKLPMENISNNKRDDN